LVVISIPKPLSQAAQVHPAHKSTWATCPINEANLTDFPTFQPAISLVDISHSFILIGINTLPVVLQSVNGSLLGGRVIGTMTRVFVVVSCQVVGWDIRSAVISSQGLALTDMSEAAQARVGQSACTLDG
jgi:hypothetical protein